MLPVLFCPFSINFFCAVLSVLVLLSFLSFSRCTFLCLLFMLGYWAFLSVYLSVPASPYLSVPSSQFSDVVFFSVPSPLYFALLSLCIFPCLLFTFLGFPVCFSLYFSYFFSVLICFFFSLLFPRNIKENYLSYLCPTAISTVMNAKTKN